MDGHDILPQLPKGWVWAQLDELAQINPKTINKTFADDAEISFLPMRAVEEQTGKYDLSIIRRYGEVKKGYTPMVDGDVIFAKITPCMENGKIAIVKELRNGVAYGSTEFHVIRTRDESLSKEYLFYFLLQENFRKDARLYMTGSAGQLRVPASFVQQSTLPIPPVPEQQRIVAKIEELFSDLDAGAVALQKAKAQLNRYRQAVLKAAVEGKLTAEWRAAHRGEVEPASALLERIRAERSKNPNGKTKALPRVDAAELGELPEGWEWTQVEDIQKLIQYGTSEKASRDSTGVPVLRMGNIQEGALNFDDLKYLPKNTPKLSAVILEDGDVLFNRTNSAELVGKTAVYKRNYPKSVFASYLIRVKVDKKIFAPDLLSFFINSFHGRRYIGSVVSQQVGQANVNGTKLSQMPIPLPPLAEQEQIVAEVERRLSVADEIEKTVDASLKQAERLRQSILKRAFAGKLVRQDPSDEPAERLLERIRAPKALSPQPQTKRPRRNKAKFRRDTNSIWQ